MPQINNILIYDPADGAHKPNTNGDTLNPTLVPDLFVKRAGDKMQGALDLKENGGRVQLASQMTFLGANSFSIFDDTAFQSDFQYISNDTPSPLFLYCEADVKISFNANPVSGFSSVALPYFDGGGNGGFFGGTNGTILFRAGSFLTLTKSVVFGGTFWFVSSDSASNTHEANLNPHPQYLQIKNAPSLNLVNNSRMISSFSDASSELPVGDFFYPPSFLNSVNSTAGWQEAGKSYHNSSTYGGSRPALTGDAKVFTDAMGSAVFGSDFFVGQIFGNSSGELEVTSGGATYCPLIVNNKIINASQYGTSTFSAWVRVVSGELVSPVKILHSKNGGNYVFSELSLMPAEGVVFLSIILFNPQLGENYSSPFFYFKKGNSTLVQMALPAIVSGNQDLTSQVPKRTFPLASVSSLRSQPSFVSKNVLLGLFSNTLGSAQTSNASFDISSYFTEYVKLSAVNIYIEFSFSGGIGGTAELLELETGQNLFKITTTQVGGNTFSANAICPVFFRPNSPKRINLTLNSSGGSSDHLVRAKIVFSGYYS
jgi:hypothetical protein